MRCHIHPTVCRTIVWSRCISGVRTSTLTISQFSITPQWSSGSTSTQHGGSTPTPLIGFSTEQGRPHAFTQDIINCFWYHQVTKLAPLQSSGWFWLLSLSADVSSHTVTGYAIIVMTWSAGHNNTMSQPGY